VAAPHIYTIAPGRPFLATLAQGVIALAGGDPVRLPQMTVLLPTRRAVRALREAFLRLTGRGGDPGRRCCCRGCARSAISTMTNIAGAREGGRRSDPGHPAGDAGIAPSLLLTRLVLGWSAARRDQPLLPGQAAALAAALARLLDKAPREGASFDKLRDLAPAQLAEHWQVVLRFLDILSRLWPPVLEAEGALDPAERRNRLWRRQAVLWRRNPPSAPVIAAGLTGGLPALTGLLSAIAWLDHGTVILPGLDRFCEPEEWELIAEEPTHPQHLNALLLRDLGIAAADVRDWPAPEAVPARQPRLRLIAEALRPAAATDAWRDLPEASPEVLAGVASYDCTSPQDEAVTIALLLRRNLETPGATAALVNAGSRAGPPGSPPSCAAGISTSTTPPACRSIAPRPALSFAWCSTWPRAHWRRCRCWPR
jgi:ATP-dependent helicase/nuclease subunit B